MTTITIDRALLEQALEALDNIPHPPWRDKELADAIRAELAKPVERVEPITLEQFRTIAHRTATTYRHRSDPEKSSYAFVDGSSFDDFWRKVCDGIAEDKWALYKGREPYTGKEPGRASDYVQGQSDGADQCADAIRKG